MHGSGNLQVWDASTRWHCLAAAPAQCFSLKSTAGLSSPGWGGGGHREETGSYRAGKLGKILPSKLNHIPYPQDGAKRGLFRVEAARLYVPGCQVGQEVSPGRKRAERLGPELKTPTPAPSPVFWMFQALHARGGGRASTCTVSHSPPHACFSFMVL